LLIPIGPSISNNNLLILHNPNQRYIGINSDISDRLKAHNEGRSPHTSKFKPGKLETYIGFLNESKAVEFEKYLKSGSGRAFANKQFWG
jgi:putative endonuclease